MKKKLKFEVIVKLESNLDHIDKKELDFMEDYIKIRLKNVWGSSLHNFHNFAYNTILVKNSKKLK